MLTRAAISATPVIAVDFTPQPEVAQFNGFREMHTIVCRSVERIFGNRNEQSALSPKSNFDSSADQAAPISRRNTAPVADELVPTLPARRTGADYYLVHTAEPVPWTSDGRLNARFAGRGVPLDGVAAAGIQGNLIESAELLIIGYAYPASDRAILLEIPRLEEE